MENVWKLYGKVTSNNKKMKILSIDSQNKTARSGYRDQEIGTRVSKKTPK